MASDPLQLTGRSAFAAAVRALVSDARRQIDVMSYDLDRAVYGSPDLVEALKLLLLSSPHARLRVLLNQPRRPVLRGHDLVELGRQMSSHVEFRELPPERIYANRGELLIVDQRAVLELREYGALESTVWRDAPGVAAEKGDYFDLLWAESLTAQDLRRLSI